MLAFGAVRTWQLGERTVSFDESALAAESAPRKFADPDWTATREPRASVALERLETLWINTGTLCNITCRNCYIESSPGNDRLVYITPAEASAYFDEIEAGGLGTRDGFTGGGESELRGFIAVALVAVYSPVKIAHFAAVGVA